MIVINGSAIRIGECSRPEQIAHCAKSEGDLPCRLSFRPARAALMAAYPRLPCAPACRITKPVGWACGAARTPTRHSSSFVSFEQRLFGFFDETCVLTPQGAGRPPRINLKGWLGNGRRSNRTLCCREAAFGRSFCLRFLISCGCVCSIRRALK